MREILMFGWSENFRHQSPENVHIDNCKKLTNCTNNKEVYLTVPLAHSREGHLQYLWSLEADLADAEQDKGEVADVQGAKRPTPTQSTCLYYDHDNDGST
jgi:hypothetical protein